MEINKILGGRIKKCRIENGLNQNDLAKMLNVSQTTITSWENKKQEPSLEKIKKLAIILNVSEEYLIGIDNQTKQNLIYLQSDDYIYSNNNYLSKMEVNKITELKNNINIIEKENFKNNNLNKTKNNIIKILELQEKIINILFANKSIFKDLINISYKKELFNPNNSTIIKPTICSNQQKNLINMLLKFDEKQCEKLNHYMYHIKNKTENEQLMYKIIFMNNDEINALKTKILGIQEESNEINKIKKVYTMENKDETRN